jgi:hypothetical protein
MRISTVPRQMARTSQAMTGESIVRRSFRRLVSQGISDRQPIGWLAPARDSWCRALRRMDFPGIAGHHAAL